MDFDKRIEFTCGKCGKTRILSPKEANEDGWRVNPESGKTECYQCIPKYGVPTTLLRGQKLPILQWMMEQEGLDLNFKFNKLRTESKYIYDKRIISKSTKYY